ncbi:SitI3 family protein [Micromonospora sp. SH-82]|uniref:SitI3 family protein n=1 Tax=Micromonospora sp. SH-82 TaxID=3132938 RepID=UPI003EC0C985
MGVEYRLTLAGGLSLDEVAALVAPHAKETTTSGGDRLLSTPTEDEPGYGVSIIEDREGWHEAESDDGQLWRWEPGRCVDVTFYMDKFADREGARGHMLRTVATVLAHRTEDAALTLNGDWLMLTRVNGKVLLHNAADWYDPSHSPF